MNCKKNILFFFIFNIICIVHIISEKDKSCIDGPDQTSEKPINYDNINNTKKVENKTKEKPHKFKDDFSDIQYSENFLKLPIITNKTINTSNYNSSEYFDLSINKKILRYVRENGVITYPRKRFKEKQQGNFLHFMHLAYDKKLPVYFAVDQIIYPYIEITKLLNFDIIEFAFFPIYKSFLKNIIDYGIKSNYNKSVVLYFTISSKFLSDKNSRETPGGRNKEAALNEKLSESIVEDLLTREQNDTSYNYNLSLLGNKRILNKFNFIKIKRSSKKGNVISQKITNSLRFFQEFILDASKELYNIYLIGKLIEQSGQEKMYLRIKKFVQYLYNEDEDNMNPLEVYHYIKNNFKNLTENETEINKLYPKIKDKIKKGKYFSFYKYINYPNEEQGKNFAQNKNKEISLFSYSTTVEDWVNDKMVNYNKGRFFPSIVELLEIVYDAKMGRNTLGARFNAKEVKDELLIFRDGIDMTEDLFHAKRIVEKSLEEEKNKWINSYENSFNYILNIIGKSAKENDRNLLIKSFNSILGSYIHFKKDILLIEQYSNITYNKNGKIPEIHFENNTKFYTELKNITLKYKEHIIDLVEGLSDKKKKERIIGVVEYKLGALFKAYDNILNILNNKDDKNNKNIIDKMFYYDAKSKQYEGWYVDLYKNDNNAVVYNLEIYGYNYYIANPIRQIKFGGAIIYEAMNYPEIGLVAINDVGNEKKKKLFLFSTYIGNEFERKYSTKVDFKGLQETIISRS